MGWGRPVLDMVSRVSFRYYIMLFIARLFTFLFRFQYLSGREVSRVRIRGVTALEVDQWASEEAPGLAEPPLNLVLYKHLRIFAYTSNTLIVSFE